MCCFNIKGLGIFFIVLGKLIIQSFDKTQTLK